MIDHDLFKLTQMELVAEVRRLRAAIRRHRDCQGHDLCWYHPELWGLLPEHKQVPIAIPPSKEFICNCVLYRASLDKPTERRSREWIDLIVAADEELTQTTEAPAKTAGPTESIGPSGTEQAPSDSSEPQAAKPESPNQADST